MRTKQTRPLKDWQAGISLVVNSRFAKPLPEPHAKVVEAAEAVAMVAAVEIAVAVEAATAAEIVAVAAEVSAADAKIELSKLSRVPIGLRLGLFLRRLRSPLLDSEILLLGRATTSGRAAQGDHKNAARPEVVALPFDPFKKVDQ